MGGPQLLYEDFVHWLHEGKVCLGTTWDEFDDGPEVRRLTTEAAVELVRTGLFALDVRDSVIDGYLDDKEEVEEWLWRNAEDQDEPVLWPGISKQGCLSCHGRGFKPDVWGHLVPCDCEEE